MSNDEFREEPATPPIGSGPPPAATHRKKPNGEDEPTDAAAMPASGKGAKAEDRKPDHLKLVPGGAPESIFDDIEGLRKVAELKVQRRVVPVNMTVRKPPDNGYFQCHPDPAQRIDASLVYDKEERDVYFVWPNMMNHPKILTRLRRMTVATTFAWPSGLVFLWAVPFPDAKGRMKVWKSARRAFEISCGLATDLDPPGPHWTQISWNEGANDYDVVTAEDIKSRPIWPAGLSLGHSLKLAFASRTIDSEDHYYMRQLRGSDE
jgi:hypothetical protein